MLQRNILIAITHPAHVHFFKHPIQLWRQQGHSLVIVTRDKDITHTLLDEMGVNYTPLTKQKHTIWSQITELFTQWAKIFALIKKHHIDVAISISGLFTAVPARLAGIAAITATDTEDATLSNQIAFRFSDIVLTPSTFMKQAAFKNIETYRSFHELAYLHPNWFTPNKSNLNYFGIREDERYVFIRLVKWKAVHDIHEQGISEEHLRMIVRLLTERHYNVFISAERALSPEFDSYLIQRNFGKIFDVMAFSSGYIGESPTMAVETAIIGKPAVLINSRVKQLGNMIELQKQYEILFNFENFDTARAFLQEEFFSDELRQHVLLGRKRLLEDKIDISRWIAQFTAEYRRGKK